MVLFRKQQDLSEPASLDPSGHRRADWDVLLRAENEHIRNLNFT